VVLRPRSGQERDHPEQESRHTLLAGSTVTSVSSGGAPELCVTGARLCLPPFPDQLELAIDLVSSRLELNDLRVHDVSFFVVGEVMTSTVGRGGARRNRPVGRD
jgi:hypothetical protein